MIAIKAGIALASAVALLTIAGTAHAADLPARVAPAPHAAPLPVFTWTGAYFGIDLGAVFDNTTHFNLSPATAADNGIGTNRPATFRNSDDGITAGGQIGYKYEIGGSDAFGPGTGVVGASGRMRPMSTPSRPAPLPATPAARR